MSSFVYIYCFCRFFFDKLLYTYLIRLQTEYPNFHANLATLISMQTRLYIANPKLCFSKKKKTLNRSKLYRQHSRRIIYFGKWKNLIFSYFFYRIIDRITEFSFIIFSDFIHFIKYFILPTIIITCSFFHCYQLYIAFYYSYVNPLTINSCDARVDNLVLF